MPLASLASLALLAGVPASAANNFSIVLDRSFGDNTGATARMDFLFGGGPSAYTLDLTINNTSPTPTTLGGNGVTASSITGFAFKLPDTIKIENLSYDRNDNKFFIPKDLTIGNFDFDFCASSDKDGSNTKSIQCGSGSTKDGLTLGVAGTTDRPSGTFKFAFNSDAADVHAVSDAFNNFFSEPTTGVNIAARFQGVNYVRNGVSKTEGSDKVTGGGSTPAPGDTVPGPVPLLGAAAAFGYSRKLRRRLKGIARAS